MFFSKFSTYAMIVLTTTSIMSAQTASLSTPSSRRYFQSAFRPLQKHTEKEERYTERENRESMHTLLPTLAHACYIAAIRMLGRLLWGLWHSRYQETTSTRTVLNMGQVHMCLRDKSVGANTVEGRIPPPRLASMQPGPVTIEHGSSTD